MQTIFHIIGYYNLVIQEKVKFLFIAYLPARPVNLEDKMGSEEDPRKTLVKGSIC